MAKAMHRGFERWGANLPSTAASARRPANGQQDRGPFCVLAGEGAKSLWRKVSGVSTAYGV